MKQKLVIKIQLCCDKCRSKAMKIAAAADGVSSVALEGVDKDRVVVVGDGVDAAELTYSLRKKFSDASLLSMEEVKPKKDDGKEKKDDGKDKPKKEPNPPKPGNPPPTPYWGPPSHPPAHGDMYKVVVEPNPSFCTLM